MNHTGSFCPIDEQERQKAKEWSACWTASQEDGREASLRTSEARLHSIRSCVSVGDRPSYVQTPSPRASVLPSVGERTGRRRSRLAPAAVEAREETYKADFGLLFCQPRHASTYETLGWCPFKR